MNYLICPVSSDRIPEAAPRLTALFVILTLILYVISGALFLLVFLLCDFLIRGYGNSRYSLLARLSGFVIKQLGVTSALIDKAPKVFAARLGVVFVLLILMSHIWSADLVGIGLSAGLILFAMAECVLNFCVGCYVYVLVVLPLQNK